MDSLNHIFSDIYFRFQLKLLQFRTSVKITVLLLKSRFRYPTTMPFFSSNRRGGGGSGFGHSPIPTTIKPKPLRKPSAGSRRRNPFSLSLSPTLFSIAISLSLLLFVAVFLRYGVPNHLSSSSSRWQKPRFLRRPVFRRPKPNLLGADVRFGRTERDGGEITTAAVDITTKDLYDRIEFRDIDGGAWKQGWKVEYEGAEWDEEKLKVFVVPHSHNDPGWKRTVEEYYNEQSRHILDTIVESLSRDERRKFIWEEMSYLERWWRDASEMSRAKFSNLVKNGQLEIVGGGWVMNDEANSHYFAIIVQMMEGNIWLNDTIGVVPQNAWAIDPFGYSSTMAYLLRRMGFHNMLIQRTHYELKKELASQKNLEYIWRQSWDVDESTDIFVHMMPFYSYDIPHTCGPEPAICCQFDFARMHGFGYEYCPWRIDPVETSPNNVQDRASKLLDQYRKKSTLYRTNTLLVPLGDDFRYVRIAEAEAQFRNYQIIFDYINNNPSLNAEVKFGTLQDYFSTLRDEAERKNYSRPGEIGSGELGGFPSLSGDFFTYADRNQDYWSGYYVSRPFFKAVDRILEQTLRASEIIAAFVLGYCQKYQCSKLPISFTYKLSAARRNLALFQHHDGVTGTSKNHVVEDYGNRMHTSLQDLQIFLSRAVEVLLGDIRDKRDPTLLSKFEPEQKRSKYDVHPIHRVLDVHEGQSHSVVFFNPLEQTRYEIVVVVTSMPDISIINSNGSCVLSQISPEWHPSGNEKVFTGRHRLYWKATVPPMGLETYYVARGFEGCEKAVPAELKLSSGLYALPCPSPYICSKLEGETAEIRNRRHTLIFDIRHGLLQKVVHKDGKTSALGEEIGIYKSSGSGAYLFKPIGEAHSIVEEGGHLLISEGPVVQEYCSVPKTTWLNTPVSHCTRLYNGENTFQDVIIEKEYHVNMQGNDFNDMELITRFKTDIDNKKVFFSDLNGFQMSRRETYDKIPLQGNYYPMPSLAFLQDSFGRRFSVHTRQSLGVASLNNGWLEIMLDRRLVNDDGRGLGQGVMDNRPMDIVFHLLTESNVSVSPSTAAFPIKQPSILSHSIGAHLNYPMHAFVSRKEEAIPSNPTLKSFAPLVSSLPCDLHVVSLNVPHLSKFLQAQPAGSRFAIMLQRRGWDSSYCRKGELQCSVVNDEPVNLFYMFKHLSVQNVKPTSLNLLHDDFEALGYAEQSGGIAQEGNVLLSPMEVQAFKLDLQRQTS